MKRLIALGLLGSIIAPQAALAHHYYSGRRSWVGYQENICYKEEVREVYVPGNRNRRGYVDYQREVVEVPCNRNRLNTENIGPWEPTPDYRPTGRVDDNSCVEGAILGGILGGGAAALGSRGDGYAWSVPLGVVAGSMIGCQVDGG